MDGSTESRRFRGKKSRCVVDTRTAVRRGISVRRYFRDVRTVIPDQPTTLLAARGRHEVVKDIPHPADERMVVPVSHRYPDVPAAELAREGFDAARFQLRREGSRDGPV
jgi:hypothetical protein